MATSDIEPLQGSSYLLDALKNVLELEEELFGWRHNEEHAFEHSEYCGLVKLFDRKVTEARDRRRPVLNRIFQLGGTLDGVQIAPEQALQELLTRLKTIHQAVKEACEQAHADLDSVTVELLTCNQKHLEKCIERITQKLAKKSIIGEQLWLDRLV